ncbi:hypothetical protein VNI00_011962 [Paramarasmius palmivorus]|uniref:Uncharacterized protein n=1 Tax=Paramarasmius palmivorus TaxID=297713 RepID=A0AAW0CC10_9AGAR
MSNKQSHGSAGSKKKSKAVDKVPTGIVGTIPTGLNTKAKSKGRKPDNDIVPDSMLQEGKSVGFEDNKNIVKIKEEPIELAVGKAARGAGEKKFSSKHLPEFIRDEGGDRKIFTPLAKITAGYVHSWGALKKTQVEAIITAGFGRTIALPESGKDAISVLANGKLSDLRHEIATGAIENVHEFIKAHWTSLPPLATGEEESEWVFRSEDDVADWAQYMTKRYSVPGSGLPLSPMHFANFHADDVTGTVLLKQGLFQHELVLHTFAIYLSHVDAIPPEKRPREVKKDGSPKFPFGMLELSIQAVERALTFFHSGRYVPPGQHDEFSYLRWGQLPVKDFHGEKTKYLKHNEFSKTIKDMGADRWQVIIDGARQYMKQKWRAAAKPQSKKRREKEDAENDESDGDEEMDIVMSDPLEPIRESLDQLLDASADQAHEPDMDSLSKPVLEPLRNEAEAEKMFMPSGSESDSGSD